MKKTLLFASLLIGGLTQLTAQCTISPSCSTGTVGYCTTPAASTNLPNGTEAVLYNSTIQVSVGASVLGGAVTITDATVNSVTGMPSGFSYSVNPSSGIINANSNACLLITGTPAAGSAGNYTISVSLSVNTSFGPTTQSVVWYLTIDPVATGLKLYSQTSNFFISPNPATSDLVISSTSHFGKVQIMDALGKIVISHDANYATQTTIDVSNLTKGVYFLQINDGAKIITRKFIKD